MPKQVHPDDLRRAAEACEDALRRYLGAQRFLYRLSSAAEALDTSPETVRVWIRSGRLTPTRIGRAVYVARDDLLAFIDQHRGPAVEE